MLWVDAPFSIGTVGGSHRLNERVEGRVLGSGGVERERMKTLPFCCNEKQLTRFPEKWKGPREDLDFAWDGSD